MNSLLGQIGTEDHGGSQSLRTELVGKAQKRSEDSGRVGLRFSPEAKTTSMKG
jgi:hypothetical protein